MPLPTYQEVMLPVLQTLSNGEPRHISEILNSAVAELRLSEEELKELLPSGQSTVIGSRIGWARTYLNKAGLIEKGEGRGVYKITFRGQKILSTNPAKIDNQTLSQFPEFESWISPKSKDSTESVVNTVPAKTAIDETPEESIETAHRILRANLVSEIIDTVKRCSPSFFEHLVVDLLVKMGYGGSYQDAGRAIGKSGDGGIDGIIKEDRLGLDVIYLQAKRWENVVGSPEIQKFAGALQGKRAKKGVFITTSNYTKGARDFAANIENKIILIDGEELADLMIDHGVGVSVVTSYEIKRIDSDYFIDE